MSSLADRPVSRKRWSYVPPNERIWHGLRRCDVTSTEAAALFGLSPYCTRLELYHRKRTKEVVAIPENERMTWGVRLQDAIAQGLGEDYGVSVQRVETYSRIVDARMGASFDYRITGILPTADSNEVIEMFRQHGPGILEIKNVDSLVFRNDWMQEDEDGRSTIEAPPHIEIQLQHQLHVDGVAWGAIGVLVGGNRPQLLIRERDIEVGLAIERRVRTLYRLIAMDAPPAPEYPQDAEFVSKLYGYAEPNKVYDGRADALLHQLCTEYAEARDKEKLAKEDKQVAKAKILEHIGDAEKALLTGFSISAGLIGPCHVEYERGGYRNFKITTKKKGAA